MKDSKIVLWAAVVLAGLSLAVGLSRPLLAQETKATQRWQYHCEGMKLRWEGILNKESKDRLNDLGKDGWEIATSWNSGQAGAPTLICFKKSL